MERAAPADVGVEGAVSVVPGVSVPVQGRCGQGAVSFFTCQSGCPSPPVPWHTAQLAWKMLSPGVAAVSGVGGDVEAGDWAGASVGSAVGYGVSAAVVAVGPGATGGLAGVATGSPPQAAGMTTAAMTSSTVPAAVPGSVFASLMGVLVIYIWAGLTARL